MVCITTQAFPTSSGPALVPPFGCQSRTLPSAFLYRRTRRLSQGTANPFRATPMVRPLCLAEPGRGDASCTTRTLAVFFHPPYRPAGQPSGIRAFRLVPIRRPVPSFQRFRPFGRRVSINGEANLPLCTLACQSRLSTLCSQKLICHLTCDCQVDETKNNRARNIFFVFAMKRMLNMTFP